MNFVYPHPSPYAEAAKQLREAIAMAAIRDAVENLVASTHSFADTPPATDLVSNGHATNIRDDIAALINEGTGLVDAAFSARISEEDRA